MSSELAEPTYQSLGDLLRIARTSKGLDFEAVAEETKISMKNLRAMEENNYDCLPAEVFTRGFYSLYARILSLDPKEILKKYENEKTFSNESESNISPTWKASKDHGTLAERPSYLPLSSIGLLLLLLLIFGAFLCWYFSWNPATYLSQKLRNGSLTALQTETTLKSPEKEFFALQSMLDIPTMSNASEVKQQFNYPLIATDNYIIKAHFNETTKVTIAIDDLPVFDNVYDKGESAAWSANKKINITLPGKTNTVLSLNETPIHLPPTDNTTLTISLPHDLLR
jgi:cytoskeletal protein RodZ